MVNPPNWRFLNHSRNISTPFKIGKAAADTTARPRRIPSPAFAFVESRTNLAPTKILQITRKRGYSDTASEKVLPDSKIPHSVSASTEMDGAINIPMTARISTVKPVMPIATRRKYLVWGVVEALSPLSETDSSDSGADTVSMTRASSRRTRYSGLQTFLNSLPLFSKRAICSATEIHGSFSLATARFVSLLSTSSSTNCSFSRFGVVYLKDKSLVPTESNVSREVSTCLSDRLFIFVEEII
mmetsp:Transcript_18834/g.37824  ORF Transcript_18834/g.37824 Transcript_18834/m.37824 type:complete len:242 (+) Transcript_18834:1638-2363(+)